MFCGNLVTTQLLSSTVSSSTQYSEQSVVSETVSKDVQAELRNLYTEVVQSVKAVCIWSWSAPPIKW